MPYEKHRRRGSRADDYLCRLCKESQASAWGHCHEHGFVRGPLCGSCNSSEGSRHPHYFLERDGGTLHLLECRACLEERTLPSRYSRYVVREHLMRTERHGRCRKQPYVCEVEQTDGVHRFHLDSVSSPAVLRLPAATLPAPHHVSSSESRDGQFHAPPRRFRTPWLWGPEAAGQAG
ncbi:endonuclease domain-containing protein [Streptomyces niveus]|uniref:endonuclease domain-containing protein n=1 Tax=Streptomyces niveus TaxID=193462 RepID=UPI002E306476|nr:endonuclease domain-containing protein [Streptomyces niveus]